MKIESYHCKLKTISFSYKSNNMHNRRSNKCHLFHKIMRFYIFIGHATCFPLLNNENVANDIKVCI